ncbi:MAG: TetR/AcrR family transcriptional regulator [Candidatus Acidiferrales bacterium]
MKTESIYPPKLGLREQNKLEKRERIRGTARDLFSRHGFDSATLRQIAHAARVGLGTLFNYAQDKRDLVFLIFNEELNQVTNQALSAPNPAEPLIDQLMAISKPHYNYYGKDPALSRILLKELVFYSEGKQAATFQKIREHLLTGIEKLVREAQRNQFIRSEASAKIIARHFFFVFSAAIRWWIADPSADPEVGLADLRRLLELQIEGLQPRARTPGRPVKAPAEQRTGRAARKVSSAAKRRSGLTRQARK